MIFGRAGAVGDQGSVAGARVRVFLLDDHELVRRGVAAQLDSRPDIQVVGEAWTVTQALSLIPVVRPDVAVLDVRLPDGDGVRVCRELRHVLPDTAFLMLTSHADEGTLAAAFAAGADGFLLKDIRGDRLVRTIRAMAPGAYGRPAITRLAITPPSIVRH